MVVWIILNGDFGWYQIATGLAASAIALAITNAMLLRNDYSTAYRFRPSALIRYAAMVLFQIYQSGIKTIPRILSGRGDVVIDEYRSSLEGDLPLVMLSTAVTLTPGTVTVALSGQMLHILHFREETAPGSPEAGNWKPVAIESVLAEKRT